MYNASPTLHIAKGCLVQAFKTFYADRNIGSRRYRDRLVDTNSTNLVRLLDNVRFSLSKGETVCGLTADRLRAAQPQPDSQTSDDQPQQDPPQGALRRKRPARKRSILRFAKKARMAGFGARVCLRSQANSLLDSWSDLEASQPTVVPDSGHGVLEDPTTVRQSHICKLF